MRAADAQLNFSDFSDVATASTLDTTAPTAPAGLTAIAVSASQINLSWTASTDNVGVTGYRVERCQGTACSIFVEIATSAQTSYSSTSLAPASSYTFRVRAADGAGNLSAFSAAATATTFTVQTQLYFIHTDHLNTPRLVADAAGTTVWKWDQQEPFGVNVPDENPSGLGAFEFPMRFPGQYADKEIGLVYNDFRDYSPQIGRYVQSDPLGLRAGMNTFGYVDGNPLIYVDPSGLDIKICHFPELPTHISFGVGDAGTAIDTYGFYPYRKRNPYGSGVIQKDDLSEPGTQCKMIKATSSQDECMTRCQYRRIKDPGKYDWYRRNCGQYVYECLTECGFNAGQNSSWPRTMFDSIPGGTAVPAMGAPPYYP